MAASLGCHIVPCKDSCADEECPPCAELSGVTIKSPKQNMNIRPYYGRPETLCCEYSSRSPAAVRWLHNGLPVHDAVEITELRGGVWVSQLTINKVTYVHDGNITCEVANAFANKSRTFLIDGKSPRCVAFKRVASQHSIVLLVNRGATL